MRVVFSSFLIPVIWRDGRVPSETVTVIPDARFGGNAYDPTQRMGSSQFPQKALAIRLYMDITLWAVTQWDIHVSFITYKSCTKKQFDKRTRSGGSCLRFDRIDPAEGGKMDETKHGRQMK